MAKLRTVHTSQIVRCSKSRQMANNKQSSRAVGWAVTFNTVVFVLGATRTRGLGWYGKVGGVAALGRSKDDKSNPGANRLGRNWYRVHGLVWHNYLAVV